MDKGRVDLWKKLWERKYDMPRSLEGKMRSQNDKKGFAIWNLASCNRDLINNHSFWEVRGDKENFQEEAWKERKKLKNQPKLAEIHQFTNLHGVNTVQNNWCLEAEGH